MDERPDHDPGDAAPSTAPTAPLASMHSAMFAHRAMMPITEEITIPLQAPDLTGLEVFDARVLAGSSGLRLSVTIRETKLGPWGLVLWQHPSPGERVRRGARIQVVVAGRPHLSVPDVRGLDVRTAIDRLRGAGLQPGIAGERASRKVMPGHVISSRPGPGMLVVHGAAVELLIARPATGRATTHPRRSSPGGSSPAIV